MFGKQDVFRFAHAMTDEVGQQAKSVKAKRRTGWRIGSVSQGAALKPVKQLAPGWRTGANCDQYPRGDRRLGEACTDLGGAYIRAGKPSARFPTHESQFAGTLRQLLALTIMPFQGPGARRVGLAIGEAQWLTTKLLH
jgi:hypothetical protein